MTDSRTRPQFYFAPGSSSLAPHVALLEAAAEFDANPVILAEGEQNTSQFRSINAKGRIPALMVNGHLITEVMGILTWIAARYPDAQLLPLADPVRLAEAYARMSWYATDLHVAVAQSFRTGRFTADESIWPTLKASARNNLETGFDLIEQALEGSWVMGEEFSVLDPYTYVMWRWAERLEFDAARYPKWQAHTQRMRQRPSVIAAMTAENEAAARGPTMAKA